MYDTIKEIVIQSIVEVQARSGRSSTPITETTCPLSQIAGFDSYNAVETAFEIGYKLGCEIPAKVMFPNSGDALPTVAHITAEILQMIQHQEGKND